MSHCHIFACFSQLLPQIAHCFVFVHPFWCVGLFVLKEKKNPYKLGTIEEDPVVYNSRIIIREIKKALLTLFDI